MHLEMFKYIDDIIDLYESKRDMFKLITEEIVSFFEDTVFTESRYTLSMASRLKSSDSIREKLLLAEEYAFHGVGYWHAGRRFAGNWSLLNVLYNIEG